MRLIDRQLSHTQMSFTSRMLGVHGPLGNTRFRRGKGAGAEFSGQAGRARRARRYSGAVTSQDGPRTTRPVEYKGEPLDAARGPGLGCFWLQMLLLLVLVIITPLSATDWAWPVWATTVLFVAMILLLLLSGQTMIFLLRLVAAGRSEGRRRPLASPTPTVGEIEDEEPAEGAPETDGAQTAAPSASADRTATPGSDVPGMRQ
jgi:hypothetical protein